jgi:hypothetical protein
MQIGSGRAQWQWKKCLGEYMAIDGHLSSANKWVSIGAAGGRH